MVPNHGIWNDDRDLCGEGHARCQKTDGCHGMIMQTGFALGRKDFACHNEFLERYEKFEVEKIDRLVPSHWWICLIHPHHFSLSSNTRGTNPFEI